MSAPSEKSEIEKVARESAEFFAMMLIHLAKSVIEDLGEEEGERVIRKGLRNFGRARGMKIRERVDSLALKPTVENFAKYYDFPMFAAWKAEREISEKKRYSKITYCPFGNFWKERGEEKIGLMYCDEVDDGIREGFDPQLIHKNPQNPLRGDPICEHIDEYHK